MGASWMSGVVPVLGAVFNLNHRAHFLNWHFIHLSWSNIIVVIVMLVVFALAIALPFPGHRAEEP